MQLGTQTSGLTARHGRDRIEIPAAPRNGGNRPNAPGSAGFAPSALLRLMKADSFLLSRTVALASAIALLLTTASFAVTSSSPKHKKKKAAVVTAKIVAPAAVTAPRARPLLAASAGAAKTRKKVYVQTWDEPTYKDSTAGDKVDGEDLTVRKAAVD